MKFIQPYFGWASNQKNLYFCTLGAAKLGLKAVSDLDKGIRKAEPEDHGRSPVWNIFGSIK